MENCKKCNGSGIHFGSGTSPHSEWRKESCDCNHKFNPVLQTTFGEEGNCLSACVVSLFDISIEEVPTFEEDEGKWAFELSCFMTKKFNKFIIPMRLERNKDMDIFNGSLIITGINSPNPKVDRHAVISQNNIIIFDPMVGKVDIAITKDMEATYMVIGDIMK